MALSDQRADELSAQEFVDDLFRFSAGALGDLTYSIFSRARENSADARSVAEGEQGLAADGRIFASIQLEDGSFQGRQITFQHGQVRYFGNLGNADGNAGSRIGKISGQIRNARTEPLAGDSGELVILPPRLGHVMIGEYAARANDKSRAKKISANFRCTPLQCINRVAIAIVERLAVRIDSPVAQGTTRSPVDEGDRHVYKTHAWRVRTNHFFSGL